MAATMTKTADQQNAERRAAKARQQAVAKARALSKEDAQKFDMVTAKKESRTRQRHLARLQFEREQEEKLRELKAKSALDQILRQGSYRSEQGRLKRDAWIADCFSLVCLIRERSDISYNKEWKETGILVAGIRR